MSQSNKFLATFRHVTRAVASSSGTGTSAKTLVPRVTKPIVSAPMNGWSGSKLVAAVANHGGMPVYPIGYYTDPAKILQELKVTTELIQDLNNPAIVNSDSDNAANGNAQAEFLPYAVGFITFWLEQQGPELLLSILRGEGDTSSSPKKRPPAAYWFSFGDYRPYLALVREHGQTGSKVIVQVGTVQEAIDAQNNKVDVIVIQGTEAGGHGLQKVNPLMTFLPEVLQALKENNPLFVPPILAAGGVSTRLQFKVLEAMGVSGVVIGTGFMPTLESPGPQKAKELLLKTREGGLSTVRTRIFDDLREFDWPEEYDGRVIRNAVTEREVKTQRVHGAEFSKGTASFKLLKEDHSGTKDDWMKANKEQDYDILPVFCGTGVGMLKKQMPAAEFMDLLLVD